MTIGMGLCAGLGVYKRLAFIAVHVAVVGYSIVVVSSVTLAARASNRGVQES
jgi:hypothetical protein